MTPAAIERYKADRADLLVACVAHRRPAVLRAEFLARVRRDTTAFEVERVASNMEWQFDRNREGRR